MAFARLFLAVFRFVLKNPALLRIYVFQNSGGELIQSSLAGRLAGLEMWWFLAAW
jgi:hypothetical protein